ncbi:MAG: regulatory protein RecX [Actinomycetota bacterium]
MVARKERGGRKLDVHDRALGLLAVRARSRSELERRLTSAGFERDEITESLDRLTAVGLVDDEAFARAFAEHAVGTRGEGKRAVESALYAKGVSRETIELVVFQVTEERGDESDRALALARSRVRRLAGSEPAAAYRKLFSFLARRGYPPSVSREAARLALEIDETVA